jgi:Zn-dependent metalloprotease
MDRAAYSEPKPCGCCFIIPTRMLERLSTSGNRDMAASAARTLRINNSLQAFRAQLNTGAPPPATPVRPGLRRQAFNCNGTEDMPGDLARSENDPPVADAAVNQAFDNAGTSWNFYKQIFGRESVDDHGRTLVSSVHYSQGYDNAFWNGQQMVYGDGDGQIFQNFTGSLDVIAHELTHGVTQFTAQLPYHDQSGALNESMSDVFGSMVKQWANGQTVDQADWLIGANIFTSSFNGHALRDMANPGTAYDDPMLGKDQQPGHMKDYVQTQDDNGGVHINSGIPNKAFVIAAKAIGGRSWEVIGKIWYVTLTERLTSSADFEKCARETISVARDLYPSDPSISARIAQAWIDVGVLAAGDAMVASLATKAAATPAIAATAPAVVGTASPAKASGLKTPAPAKAKKRAAHHREKPQAPHQPPQ